jgi:predicted Holliday junction resolvase-like endonuclease
VANLQESLNLESCLVTADKDKTLQKALEIRAPEIKAQMMEEVAEATLIQRTMAEKEGKAAKMEEEIRRQEREGIEKREERDLVAIDPQELVLIFCRIGRQMLVNASRLCANFEDAR